jgi:glutaminyl-tRNA synthetase
VHLIKQGLAYVDDDSAADMRASAATSPHPARARPARERSVEENLDLFAG